MWGVTTTPTEVMGVKKVCWVEKLRSLVGNRDFLWRCLWGLSLSSLVIFCLFLLSSCFPAACAAMVLLVLIALVASVGGLLKSIPDWRFGLKESRCFSVMALQKL